MRIAIVGAGIAGLGAAYALRGQAQITIFERGDHLGGHANTREIILPGGQSQPVDTGFIVYNERNYPNLTALFADLSVETMATDMSFAISADGGQLEYSGSGLNGLFGQRRNLLNPQFWRMIRDVLRFWREARIHLQEIGESDLETTLDRFLRDGEYGPELTRDHLLPMAAAIWSAPHHDIRAFPIARFARFFENHGLMQLKDRPRWRTVTGGSRVYVAKLVAALGPAITFCGAAERIGRDAGGVWIASAAGRQSFDAAILACPADCTLGLLSDADAQERDLLSRFRFAPNTAWLHSDPALMPRRRRIWSSWNVLQSCEDREAQPVAVSYWMNRLQPFIDLSYPLFVTLNPPQPPARDKTHTQIDYRHPIFDYSTLRAQQDIAQIQGRGGVHHAGAWLGYGFHEDGLNAGLAAARAVLLSTTRRAAE